jgi:hypothetical protein
MNHRPYPNAARALHQLDRHEQPDTTPTVTLPPATAWVMRNMLDVMRAIRVAPVGPLFAPPSPEAMAKLRRSIAEAMAPLVVVGQPEDRRNP